VAGSFNRREFSYFITTGIFFTNGANTGFLRQVVLCGFVVAVNS
jgi:hypothetical protein